ncbi:hypothetical protein T11_11911 [Trichinella zimbabwensis]|uniref:Uncharacterized protein n=1 Tax=Trichinella zimbabwensis TaxID=268475 RepID=A0A0V1GLA8_9BILA|nr:hypothetical protein T11_11911 [Trichinella zimbabwensis]
MGCRILAVFQPYTILRESHYFLRPILAVFQLYVVQN